MAEDIPGKFNVVIIGTGLSESVLAAALSRQGLSVLHLDRNAYYGSGEATLSFKALLDLCPDSQLTDQHDDRPESAPERFRLNHRSKAVSNFYLDTFRISEMELEVYKEITRCGAELSSIKSEMDSLQTELEQLTRRSAVAAGGDIAQAERTELASGPEPFKKTTGLREKPEAAAEKLEATAEMPESTTKKSEATPEKPEATSSCIVDLQEAAKQTNLTVEQGHANCQQKVLESLQEQHGELSGKLKLLEAKIHPVVLSYFRAITQSDSLTTPVAQGDSLTAPVAQGDSLTASVAQGDFVTAPAQGIPVTVPEVDAADSTKDLENKLILFLEKSNRFIFDLTPKVLYSNGDMVKLLISSDVARYLEFKSFTHLLTIKQGKLESVPCSRADIFSNKSLSMIEKRLLMKLLTLCVEKEKHQTLMQEYAEKPFVEFLKSQKLTDNLIHYVVHSIAMAPINMNTSQALARLEMFYQSVGRYSSLPFLWPLYGGEMNQAFCRMSAVFGGCYILQKSVTHLNMENCEDDQRQRVASVTLDCGQTISCDWFISNADYLPTTAQSSREEPRVSRAVLLTDRSLISTQKEELLFLSMPHTDPSKEPISIIELGPGCYVCPSNIGPLRMVHLTSPSVSQTSREDLEPIVTQLFTHQQTDGKEVKPRILMCSYWNQRDFTQANLDTPTPNFLYTRGPDASIHPDFSVEEAHRLFETICPGEDFLPRPPNPEDIIYCDDTEKSATEPTDFQPSPDPENDPTPETQGLEVSKSHDSMVTDTPRSASAEAETDSNNITAAEQTSNHDVKSVSADSVG